MADKPNRKNITFEEAEGVIPLPRQLELKEVSQELRALVWDYLYKSITTTEGFGSKFIKEPWIDILRDMHVWRFHLMIDEFDPSWRAQSSSIKKIIADGSYVDVFGFLQWVMRHRKRPPRLAEIVDLLLKETRAAYRVIDDDTIVPISSPEELRTFERAIADLASTEFKGSRRHLKAAAEQATAGNWADSIRESIHAVEAAARTIVPDAKKLDTALSKLEQHKAIHRALKQGFGAIYGFASDEKGIRHPLIDEDRANVDETDALFMLGACSAFVSYLISKARTSGLLSEP